MSYLENLPEEILIIITKQLDIKSQINLYQTCKRMQSIVAINGVITACNFSLNTLATANSLRLAVVKVISGHLCTLNMSGVSDLTFTSLIQALKKMKCLTTLDVSYTRIVIEDLCDIHSACPTIKNITMDYLFKDFLPLKGAEALVNCQKAFKNITDLHLVMRGDLYQKPTVILSESAFNNLTFTFCDWKNVVYLEEIITICKYNHLSIFIIHKAMHLNQMNYTSWSVFFPLFESADMEYIIFHYDKFYSIWASPQFEDFFSEHFTIKSLNFVQLNTSDSEYIFAGNVGMFIWKRATTTFDKLFFCNLKNRLKKVFMYQVDVTNAEPTQTCVDAKDYNVFKIYQNQQNSNKAYNNEPDFKRKRCVSSCQALNYDNIFCDHDTVDLSIYFCNPGIVTLSVTDTYLKKLTYLSLAGSSVRYSNEFFNILFRCCENLATLNVESPSVYPCSGAIARSIPLSKSIKNIRILDKRIDFNTLFSSFSQCIILENIYVVDRSTNFSGLPNPTPMFKKCTNLYNLYIEGIFSNARERRYFRILNTAKKNCSMDYLNLTLQAINSKIAYTHTPYINIFNLLPIKPV